MPRKGQQKSEFFWWLHPDNKKWVDAHLLGTFTYTCLCASITLVGLLVKMLLVYLFACAIVRCLCRSKHLWLPYTTSVLNKGAFLFWGGGVEVNVKEVGQSRKSTWICSIGNLLILSRIVPTQSPSPNNASNIFSVQNNVQSKMYLPNSSQYLGSSSMDFYKLRRTPTHSFDVM